jgi:serine/threonine protein kinase
LDNLRLIDFGTAKSFENLKSKDGNTQLRERVGTMAYIAPEILHLKTNSSHDSPDSYYSEKCDMWSIGVMAYMLLCGKNPFLTEQD